MKKEWEWISKSELERSIQKLYKSKLIKEKCNRDGSLTMILSETGKELALTYNLDTMLLTKTKASAALWPLVKASRTSIFFFIGSFLEFGLKVCCYQYATLNQKLS
ncbi:MAG: hypothetical protein HYV67_01670 [Candidatus Taylorbacteria bacterium]|nr:hypothetical protein [Candidatus Taylorbacteria bacterium]